MKESILGRPLGGGWDCTDDDSAQYISRDIRGRLFELVQVCALGEEYGVAHDVIDIETYSDDDIEDALRAYGYDNIDDFVQQCSPEIIPKLADGSLDKDSLSYIIDYGLIAEMLFELEALECLLPKKYPTFEAAEKAIQSMLSK